MTFLNGPQMAKEEFLYSEAEKDGKKDAHISQNHKTRIALREINACGIEIWPLLECSEYNSGRKGGAQGTVCNKTHIQISSSSPGFLNPSVRGKTRTDLRGRLSTRMRTSLG